jgi:hypothetical protein
LHLAETPAAVRRLPVQSGAFLSIHPPEILVYVLVVHNVTDRQNFFDTAAKAIPQVPSKLEEPLSA